MNFLWLGHAPKTDTVQGILFSDHRQIANLSTEKGFILHFEAFSLFCLFDSILLSKHFYNVMLFSCKLTKDHKCKMLLSKEAQWIITMKARQGQDMNDKRLSWMKTVQLKCLGKPAQTSSPSFLPRWLQLQLHQYSGIQSSTCGSWHPKRITHLQIIIILVCLL